MPHGTYRPAVRHLGALGCGQNQPRQGAARTRAPSWWSRFRTPRAAARARNRRPRLPLRRQRRNSSAWPPRRVPRARPGVRQPLRHRPRAGQRAVWPPGSSVLLEIDWQGARQVRQSVPGLRLDIHPAALARGRSRSGCARASTDSDAVIARRLADAATDMSHCLEFDYAVVNDRFEQAVARSADHHRRPRRRAERKQAGNQCLAGLISGVRPRQLAYTA